MALSKSGAVLEADGHRSEFTEVQGLLLSDLMSLSNQDMQVSVYNFHLNTLSIFFLFQF